MGGRFFISSAQLGLRYEGLNDSYLSALDKLILLADLMALPASLLGMRIESGVHAASDYFL